MGDSSFRSNHGLTARVDFFGRDGQRVSRWKSVEGWADSASNNSHAFAGFCGLFDCGKSLVKSNRIIKTRRGAGSVTQIMRHQPVHACNVARRYSVFEAKVKRRRNFPIKDDLDKAECRQFKTFQSLILSFPSFG
jgi:hypothetical protein